MLEDGRVLESFMAANITAVFNTTQPGEHPFCGAGILEQTGFPYSPEKLMAVGIKHFNYGWPDMTIPSIHCMMNIVQIAKSEISSGGKIAIHCHAGFGRTGIAIACILMVLHDMDGSAAIQLVRDRRPGSIQTKPQQQFVFDFEIYYRQLRCIFPPSIMDHSDEVPRRTIQQSVMDQQYLLKASERYTDKYRYIHKVMYHISQALSSYRKNKNRKKSITTISSMAIIGLSVFRPEKYHDSSAHSSHDKAGAAAADDDDAMVDSTVDRWFSTPHVLDERVFDLVRSIKDDINGNRWERFYMICEVVSLSDCFIASSSEKAEEEAQTPLPHRVPSFILVLPTSTQGDQLMMSDNINVSCNMKLDKMREVNGDNNASSSSVVNGHPPSSTALIVDDVESILDETTLTSVLPTVFSTPSSNQPLLNHTDINQYPHSNIHHQIKSNSTTKLPYLSPNKSAQQLLDAHSIGSSSVPLFPSLAAVSSSNNNNSKSGDDDLRNPLLNRTTCTMSYDRSAVVGYSNKGDDDVGYTNKAPLELNIHELNESNFATYNSPVIRPARAISVGRIATTAHAEGGGGYRHRKVVTSDDDEIGGDSRSKGHVMNNGTGGTNENIPSALSHSTSNTTSAVNSNNYMSASINDTTSAVIALSHLLLDWLESHTDELLSTDLIAQLDSIWRRAIPLHNDDSNNCSYLLNTAGEIVRTVYVLCTVYIFIQYVCM